MLDELRKIFSARWAVLTMAAALLLNGLLFYRRCVGVDPETGYSPVQIRRKYSDIDVLPEEAERLGERLMTARPRDDSLITGNVLTEYRLDLQVLARVEAARGHSGAVEELIAGNRMKLSAGFFGGGDSTAERIMRRSIEKYAPLAGLQVPAEFSGGVEALADFHVTDLMTLVFAAIPALALLTYERGRGLTLLTRPMRYGRARLYFRKLGAMAVTVTAGFLLLEGSNITISALTLGLGDLARPVQAVYGYELCPEPLTCAGFLLTLLARRLFLYLTVGAILFALAAFF